MLGDLIRSILVTEKCINESGVRPGARSEGASLYNIIKLSTLNPSEESVVCFGVDNNFRRMCVTSPCVYFIGKHDKESSMILARIWKVHSNLCGMTSHHYVAQIKSDLV